MMSKNKHVQRILAVKPLQGCTFLLLILILYAFPAKSQVYVGGHLTSDTTFYPSNNPYVVTQDFIIDAGITLTILPGVVIDFYNSTGIVSNGTLIAKGTPTRKIIFRPRNPLPYPGQWDGITFNSSNTILSDGDYLSGPVFTNVYISKAAYGVTLDKFSSLLVDSCNFDRCSFGVFIAEAKSNVIRQNVFKNCDFGIFIAGGYTNPDNLIADNRIAGSSDIGIFLNNFPDESYNQTITNNYINNCSIGVHIGNYGLQGSGKHLITNNIFNKNGTALFLFQDSSIIKNNYFTADTSAFICYGSSYNQIIENVFAGNTEVGLSLQSTSSLNTISYNSFSYNKIGSTILSGGNDEISIFNNITYNSFFNNINQGTIRIESAPQGPIQFNNFKNNGNYKSFINNSSGLLHTEYCYWGVQNLSAIDSIIFDVNDQADKGEVIYKPVFMEELTIAPLLPPEDVTKQLINNQVFVQYKKALAVNISGYYIHHGMGNATGFAEKIPNGSNVSFLFAGANLFDTIAVTAFDKQADGIMDQLQGHESCYAYAKIIPYAGSDTAICFNAEISITQANATGFSSVAWSTSGDGSFSNPQSLQTVYTPGPSDFWQGYTYLYLTGINPGDSATDSMKITFHDEPLVNLVADTTLFVETSFSLGELNITGYNHIKWFTSGDGAFNFDTLVSPVYTPGPEDFALQEVTLTCNAYSACGSASGSIVVHFDLGFSITGKVHAGIVKISDCNVLLYGNNSGKMAEVKSVQTDMDGVFSVAGLIAGEYFLYAIPNEQLFDDTYLPTYYYNHLHWEEAYQMPLYQNVYDVDIQLVKQNVILPPGSAKIEGIVTQLSGSSNKCTDVTIFLFDKNKKNIFKWVRISKGNNFTFDELPYGVYYLIGEKAGSPLFESGLISVSPQNPVVDNIEIVCTLAGMSFKAIPGSESVVSKIQFFPNPTFGELCIKNIENSNSPSVRVFNSQGQQVSCKIIVQADRMVLNLIDIPAGLYYIEVLEAGMLVTAGKILKL